MESGEGSIFTFSAAEDCGRVHNGADDAGVGGAAADVPGEGGFYVVLGRIGILVEEGFGGYDPSSGAETAVGSYADVAYALEGVEVVRSWNAAASRMYAFDGEDVLVGGFGGQGVAGVDRGAIDQDAACAATGAVATAVRPGHPELHRDDFPQRGARFILGEMRLPVDDERGALRGHWCGKSENCRAGQKRRFASDGCQGDTSARGFQKIASRVTHCDPP